MANKFEREELVARRFSAYLATRGHLAEFSRGEDPPDFNFIVDHSKWAVEVTEIHQDDLLGIPSPAQQASGEKVVNEIKCWRSEIYTFGHIFINFSRHISRREHKGLVRKIKAEILTFEPMSRIEISPGVQLFWQGGSPDVSGTYFVGVDDDQAFKSPLKRLLDAKIPKLCNLSGKFDILVLVIDFGIMGRFHEDGFVNRLRGLVRDVRPQIMGVKVFATGYGGTASLSD